MQNACSFSFKLVAVLAVTGLEAVAALEATAANSAAVVERVLVLRLDVGAAGGGKEGLGAVRTA